MVPTLKALLAAGLLCGLTALGLCALTTLPARATEPTMILPALRFWPKMVWSTAPRCPALQMMFERYAGQTFFVDSYAHAEERVVWRGVVRSNGVQFVKGTIDGRTVYVVNERIWDCTPRPLAD
jgi:hypothetical protein